MQYIGRDLADEDDIEDIHNQIDAILDILHMKGIIDQETDHWNVVQFRNHMRDIQEMEKE